MRKLLLGILFIFSIFLFACSNQSSTTGKNNLNEKIPQEENIMEKTSTISVEEISKIGNISNLEEEKQGKIKFHKFIIPSMNIALYDTNPNNPEILVEDEAFSSDNELEIPYHGIETPLPDLVKGDGGFVKMFKKDVNINFDQVVESQDWKTILNTIVIDSSLDLGNIDDIELKKSNNLDLVNINDIGNIEAYELVSNTSNYLFYIYLDKTKADRYYLVGIADGCAPTPCGNIVSIELLK